MSICKRVLTATVVLFAALFLAPAAASAMTLYAEFEDGSHDCLTLELESGESIDNVKKMIGTETSELPDQMALCYDETILYTGRTLMDYNVQTESTVTVKKAAPVTIDEEHFPDAAFREFVTRYDTNKDGTTVDGKLSAEEIVDVTEMDCQQHQISDLSGIEYFVALKSLDCSYNPLTSLDLRGNTMLTYLACERNQLTSLNVSGNVNLEELWVDGNPLSSLDLSKNNKLTSLSCGRCGLTSLDVSMNPELVDLECVSNKLSSLDVSKNAKLQSLACSRNDLAELALDRNVLLAKLYCDSNRLETLDVSNCQGLRILECDENQLRVLDTSRNPGLWYLTCWDNQLTSLDLSKNTKLASFGCNRCSRLIGVDASRSFDLSTLPGFDVSKASEWDGGSVKGTVLTVDDGTEDVTYTYDCGTFKPVTFTLQVGYAVTFDIAGGSEVESQTVAKDGAATKPADPTKDNNTFAGWYADEACTQAYDFSAPVTKATTIYAKWTPVEDKGEDDKQQDETDKGNKGDKTKKPSGTIPQTGDQSAWPLALLAGSAALAVALAINRRHNN